MRKDKLRRRKSLTQVHNCKRIIYYNFLLYRNSMKIRSQLNLCCPTRARWRKKRSLITIALIARGDKVSTHLRVMSCFVGKTIAPIVYADLVEPALYPWCESVVPEGGFTVDNREVLTHCEASQISGWIMFEDTLICPLLGCGCQFIVPGLSVRDLWLNMGGQANTQTHLPFPPYFELEAAHWPNRAPQRLSVYCVSLKSQLSPIEVPQSLWNN